jgi:hypothetical protein
MTDIRVIVPDELKANVQSILKQNDLTISQAVRRFLREGYNSTNCATPLPLGGDVGTMSKVAPMDLPLVKPIGWLA